MSLEFRPEPHEYHDDGRRIPGFHDVGRAVGLFPHTDRIPERYRIAGQYLHSAIHYAIDGDLDESTVQDA